ncbi:MAG: hypothetical protein P8X94_14760, partial [Woeseiaceae bacterium]
MAADEVEKASDGRCPSGPAGEAAMQADRHHAPAFFVQGLERVLEVAIKLPARVKSLRGREAHIVGIERVRHHELRPVERQVPV